MKLLDREEPMDPRAREELEAVDRALGGATVEPEHAEWAELTALLLDERPEPDEDWAAELDRTAAAGFPRRGSSASASGLREKLSGIRPMRIAGPAGALASVLVVAVVAFSTLGGGDESGGPDAAAAVPATVESSATQSRRSRGTASTGMTTIAGQFCRGGGGPAERHEAGGRYSATDTDCTTSGTTATGRQDRPRHGEPPGRSRRPAHPLDQARPGPRGVRSGDRDHPLARRHRRLLPGQHRRHGRPQRAVDRHAPADHPLPQPRRGDRPAHGTRQRRLAQRGDRGHHPPRRQRSGRARRRRGAAPPAARGARQRDDRGGGGVAAAADRGRPATRSPGPRRRSRTSPAAPASPTSP